MWQPISPPQADEEERSVFDEYTEHVLAEVTVSEPRLKLAADAANGMGTIYLPILEQLNVDLDSALLRARRHLPEPRGEPAQARKPGGRRTARSRSTAATSAWPSTATPTAPS